MIHLSHRDVIALSRYLMFGLNILFWVRLFFEERFDLSHVVLEDSGLYDRCDWHLCVDWERYLREFRSLDHGRRTVLRSCPALCSRRHLYVLHRLRGLCWIAERKHLFIALRKHLFITGTTNFFLIDSKRFSSSVSLWQWSFSFNWHSAHWSSSIAKR